jgi:mono/diheme cytochrome c family protein
MIINYGILASICIAGGLALGGCVCPPEGCGTAAAPGGGSSADGAKASPSGDRHVFWDGEGQGASAKGWADCDKKPACKGTLSPAPGKGVKDSTALQLHGDGPGWIGGGWNFFGWYPEDAGVDISGFSKLTLSIKVVAESEELAPDPGAVTVGLRCSKTKKDSAAVALKNYEPKLLDGQWHQVSIPLGEFTKEEFDPKSTWEFVVSTWAGNPKKFDIYFDDIAVQKSGGAQSAVAAAPADGANLFSQHCASCHGDRGQGLVHAPAIIGPGALAEYPTQATSASNPQLSNPGQVRTQKLTQVTGAAVRAPFRTAADVYQYVSTRMPMPAKNAGSLTAQEYWAILSFMLTSHGAQVPEGGVNEANAASIALPAK